MDIATGQTDLNAHGFPCGAADGVAGPTNRYQLALFQAAYCGPGGWLAIDGQFGPQTANVLQWMQDNNALVSCFTIPEVACHDCGLACVKRELLSALFKLVRDTDR